MKESAAAYCEAEVRRDDPDRWLATLFLPEAARAPVHALLAFNGEIAKIRDLVSEPMLGEIRYQWWRDAMHRTAAAAGGNPGGRGVASIRSPPSTSTRNACSR